MACCFSQAACSLCCACLPSIASSVSTRIGYAFILLVASLISIILMLKPVEIEMAKVSQYCKYITTIECEKIVGPRTVYRIFMGLSFFYLLMSLIMIKVQSSKDIRVNFQKGFWLIKIILANVLIGLTFLIPFDDYSDKVWFIISIIFASIFILMQLVLLIDFAHTWSKILIEKSEESYDDGGCFSNGWTLFIGIASAISYLVSLILIILSIVYFSNNVGCSLQKASISINVCFSIAFSVLSVTKFVREKTPYSGLLQSSMISIYSSYLLFSGLLNFKDPQCNLLLQQKSVDSLNTWLGILTSLFTIILIIYSCFSSSEQADSFVINSSSVNGSNQGQVVVDDETDGLKYNYSLFHILMMVASMYIQLFLTGWNLPSSNIDQSTNYSMASAWVKLVSSWICMIIYSWTLLAPVILKDREFQV